MQWAAFHNIFFTANITSPYCVYKGVWKNINVLIARGIMLCFSVLLWSFQCSFCILGLNNSGSKQKVIQEFLGLEYFSKPSLPPQQPSKQMKTFSKIQVKTLKPITTKHMQHLKTTGKIVPCVKLGWGVCSCILLCFTTKLKLYDFRCQSEIPLAPHIINIVST